MEVNNGKIEDFDDIVLEKVKQLYSPLEISESLGVTEVKIKKSIKRLEEQKKLSPSIRLELKGKVIKLIANGDMDTLRTLKINPNAIKKYSSRTYQENETKKSIDEQAVQMMRDGKELGEIVEKFNLNKNQVSRLRKTKILDLYNNGYTIEEIQEELGEYNIAAVRIKRFIDQYLNDENKMPNGRNTKLYNKDTKRAFVVNKPTNDSNFKSFEDKKLDNIEKEDKSNKTEKDRETIEMSKKEYKKTPKEELILKGIDSNVKKIVTKINDNKWDKDIYQELRDVVSSKNISVYSYNLIMKTLIKNDKNDVALDLINAKLADGFLEKEKREKFEYIGKEIKKTIQQRKAITLIRQGNLNFKRISEMTGLSEYAIRELSEKIGVKMVDKKKADDKNNPFDFSEL